jgi:amidase
MAGRETIGGCPGPMAADRDALEIFMKVALSAKPWRIDPGLTVKDWTPYSFTSRPKIAIQWVGVLSFLESVQKSAPLTQE